MRKYFDFKKSCEKKHTEHLKTRSCFQSTWPSRLEAERSDTLEVWSFQKQNHAAGGDTCQQSLRVGCNSPHQSKEKAIHSKMKPNVIVRFLGSFFSRRHTFFLWFFGFLTNSARQLAG